MSKKSVKADQVRVRMYRHGLGDCFLVRFPKDDGDGAFNVLIDCGLIAVAENPRPTMEGVVQNIAAECDNHLDLVIMTHEHWDHASGFSTQQAQAAFDKIDIDEVWYAWTEDPESRLGRKLRKEREAKVAALHAASVALKGNGEPLAVERAERIMSVLQFFGVANAADLGALSASGGVGKTRAAFEYLGKRRGVKTRYCYPDKPPMSLRGVSGVRAYVMGPPQDEAYIKRSTPTKKGQEVYEFAGESMAIDNLAAAFERLGAETRGDGADRPFDGGLCLSLTGSLPPSPKLAELMKGTWDAADQAWRKIDLDWTTAAETLALNLDSHTNNTCLVIAFELTDSGRVLLFAADAQIGNWLSWQETKWRVKDDGAARDVTGPDLLERAVFYKVGHHGSHNATLRALGLEQMTSEDLVAFVPVFAAQAVKNRWLKMPFKPLVQRLKEKTGGRLVFSDPEMVPPGTKDLQALSATQRKEFAAALKVDPDFYEYTFEM